MPATGARMARVDNRVAAAASWLIDRGDLVATLDRAAARKVTVISAPAGSGKARGRDEGPMIRGSHAEGASQVRVPASMSAHTLWIQASSAVMTPSEYWCSR